MIAVQELRTGNDIMQKVDTRIIKKKCGPEHIALAAEGSKNIYPIMLNGDILLRCGFIENKDYPLLPAAREFILLLPGSSDAEIRAYTKNNGECFARAMLNKIAISVPVYHLHQLQNLYYALAGREIGG